ncbi:MAG: GAF domain-containing protein [Proteobacteria bacterium]|nr:GAF domain-containing protein [Pseudomonadota bacterium]
MQRLAALRALGLLDSAPEQAFDSIVELARRLLDVPTALISLVDSDRQWFKAACGLGASQTSRTVSFCAHAIHQSEVFVVPDATFDPRFHDNPLVVGEPHIRFYAGFPLELPNGYRIGTLCALSPVPREELDEEGRTRMRLLGGLVLEAIELRAMRSDLARVRTRLDRHAALWHSLDLPVAFADAAGRIESCNAAFALLCDTGDPVGRPLADALGLPDGAWSAGKSGDWISHIAAGPASVKLSVYRSVGGFALLGEPGAAP